MCDYDAGRGGETMKLITRTTGAKVSCSKEKTHGPGAKGSVTITGTRQEVQRAEVSSILFGTVWSVLVFRHAELNTCGICLQELILEKVREDMMVRTKISQSSALRQKRGPAVVSQRPDSPDTETPVGLNNNAPYSQTEKNGLIYANGSTGEPEDTLEKMEELKTNSTDNEEESLSTDSLSEVSKFES